MIDASERALLDETVRKAIASACATVDGGLAVDAVLTQLGWLELLEAEPRDAIDIVFGALGAANAAATALDDAMAAALGATPGTGLAVLYPPFGAWDPPGRIDGNRLHARGLATARVASATEVLVVCGSGDGLWAATVPRKDVECSAVGGIDPDAGFRAARVRGATVVAKRLETPAWESAVALGRRAVAHQIAGASRAMLALARSHALERVQFGKPIARFQAVRHRLAEVLVAVESIDAALGAAGDEPNPDTAALAKAVAGRMVRIVTAHCQQVLAGIGFTTEHPFHRFLKRTMLLEGLFGSADEIALAFGRRLIAARTVPTLIEL
jgi:Acyl-CoA dehydrogenase, C-terminal domain